MTIKPPSSLLQLVGAMEELRQCRLQQWNISATVDKLSQCLPGESPAEEDGGAWGRPCLPDLSVCFRSFC